MRSPTGWAEPGQHPEFGEFDGAEYISVCVPSFAPETVHRDEQAATPVVRT
jgi:hypothetical protein